MSNEMLLSIGALSLITASVAGVLGAGGDILFVPLMLYALPSIGGGALDIHAIGVLSLVQSLTSTGSGGLVHYLDRRVHGASLRTPALCLAGGALAGGVLSRFVAGDVLLIMFAIVASGVVGLLAIPPRPSEMRPNGTRDPVAPCLFAMNALLCGMIGVGGGFLIVTILLYRTRLPMQIAKGTALVLTVCTAAPALFGKLATGQLASWQPIPIIIAAALLGGFLGARTSALLPARTLRLGLAGLVVILAARTWIGVLA